MNIDGESVIFVGALFYMFTTIFDIMLNVQISAIILSLSIIFVGLVMKWWNWINHPYIEEVSYQ